MPTISLSQILNCHNTTTRGKGRRTVVKKSHRHSHARGATPGPRLPRTASTRSNLPETIFPDPDLLPGGPLPSTKPILFKKKSTPTNQTSRGERRSVASAQQNPEETQLTVSPRLDSHVPARRRRARPRSDGPTPLASFLSLPPHSRHSSHCPYISIPLQ